MSKLKIKYMTVVIGMLFGTTAFADAGTIETSAGLAWVNGGNVKSPVLNAEASNNVTPVVALTYYATKNFAIGSVAGVSRHEFSNSSGGLGKASIIPVNLTGQWHFSPENKIDPYVGAGLNYTFFIHQTGALGTLKHIDPTLGAVLQAGVNFYTGDKWFVNADYKKFWIRPDLETAAGVKIEKIKLDPDVVTLSLGMKF